MNLIYSPEGRSLSVLPFDTKGCCIGNNHTKVTYSQPKGEHKILKFPYMEIQKAVLCSGLVEELPFKALFT